MADTSIKIDESTRDEINKLISAGSAPTQKEMLQKLIDTYKLQQIQETVPELLPDIQELNLLLNRITKIYIGVGERFETLFNEKGKAFEEKNQDLQQQINNQKEENQKLISENEDLKKLTEELQKEKEKIISDNNTNINRINTEYSKLNEVYESNKALVEEYKRKNDTLTGLLDEYKEYKAKNNNLMDQLRQLKSENETYAQSLKDKEFEAKEMLLVHEKEMLDLKEKQNIEVSKLKEQYNEKIKSMLEEKEKIINESTAKISHISNQYSKLSQIYGKDDNNQESKDLNIYNKFLTDIQIDIMKERFKGEEQLIENILDLVKDMIISDKTKIKGQYKNKNIMQAALSKINSEKFIDIMNRFLEASKGTEIKNVEAYVKSLIYDICISGSLKVKNEVDNS